MYIIRDTREKENHGWTFPARDWCSGTIDQGLETADYTIQGYEQIVLIERKASASEVFGNLYQARFERELCRMDACKHPFVICEFPYAELAEFPDLSDLPWKVKNKLKRRGKGLVKRLSEVCLTHPSIQWCFAGSPEYAQKLTASILKRTFEKYGKVQD